MSHLEMVQLTTLSLDYVYIVIGVNFSGKGQHNVYAVIMISLQNLNTYIIFIIDELHNIFWLILQYSYHSSIQQMSQFSIMFIDVVHHCKNDIGFFLPQFTGKLTDWWIILKICNFFKNKKPYWRNDTKNK